MRRHRLVAAVTIVVRAGVLAGALTGCAAAAADPQVYAERALREDALEAALAVEPLGGEMDRLRIDTGAVSRALGAPGELHGGVYAVRLSNGTAVFHPAGGGDAALTGDIVLPAKDVAATVRALAAQGIRVTNVRPDSLAALDSAPNHPEDAVLHVWAVNDAATVARGLRAALGPANER
jgi:hypothetical protein